MDPRVLPPLDGSMTLSEVIDFHIEYNTYKPVYIFSEDGKQDVTAISYLEFGRAADRVAQRLRPGRNGTDRQVIAFVALSDTLLYLAVIVGILRAGLIPYPMSPNTAAAIVKLLKDTSCHRLLATQETLRPLVDDVQSHLSSSDTTYDLAIEEVPPLLEILPKLGQEKLDDPFELYPRGARPPLGGIAMYIHSSGSTGMPKTIAQTTRVMMEWSSIPSVTDCKKPGLKMATMALPSFHMMGVIVQIMIGYFGMQPICLYPPVASSPTGQPMIPSPDNIMDHIKRTGAKGLVIVPALLQTWANDKNALRVLSSLDYVVYSGGGLPSKLRDSLTDSGVYLTAVYGATEFEAPTSFYRREEDSKEWDYLEFSDLANIRWNPQGDGTFELQVLTCDTHHVAVENLPDVKGYSSSDLWIPHPTKPDLWKIVGRKDDVIVHTSGEKTVPAPMENILMSSPYIMGTVMFGREREQAGVLVELKPAPIVEEANKVGPAFSRIFKEMVLITSPQKPLPRAGKGTVMRKAATALYAPEIDAIYAQANATVDSERVVPPSSWDVESIMAWLKNQVDEILSGQSVSFSLGATILRRRVVSALKTDQTQKASQLVSQSTIYNYSSIEKLPAFLVGIMVDPDAFVLDSNKADAVDLMISKYTTGLSEPIRSDPAVKPVNDGIVVLLTGSTGNLGAQILEALLRDPRVSLVYTLNRPAPGSRHPKNKQIERFIDKGLDFDLLESPRLVPLEGDASQKNLGLGANVYEQLRSSVTTIIHNAWKLDFNQSLSSFEPNIQGTRNLVDLARSSQFAGSIRILFTSSVSSAYSWDKTKGPYPEEVVADSRYALGNGYGESKYVAERILAQSGLQATSFRIGQITGGAPNRAWATSDWVPILVKSSIHLGALPSAVGVASWLPIHTVSQAILDVVWSPEPSPPALNLVHPRPVSWNSIFSSINEALAQQGILTVELPFVTFQEWFSLLQNKSTSSSEDTLRDIPALKFLDFFRLNANMDEILRKQGVEIVESGGLATFSAEKIASISKTVETLPSLEPMNASLWIKYWKNIGFF